MSYDQYEERWRDLMAMRLDISQSSDVCVPFKSGCLSGIKMKVGGARGGGK